MIVETMRENKNEIVKKKRIDSHFVCNASLSETFNHSFSTYIQLVVSCDPQALTISDNQIVTYGLFHVPPIDPTTTTTQWIL